MKVFGIGKKTLCIVFSIGKKSLYARAPKQRQAHGSRLVSKRLPPLQDLIMRTAEVITIICRDPVAFASFVQQDKHLPA